MRNLVCVILLSAIAPLPARAASTDAQPETVARDTLAYDWWIDGGIVLATGVPWLASEAFKSHLAPTACRWCMRNEFDDTATNALAWKNIKVAATIGNVGAFVVTPLATAGTLLLSAALDERGQEMPANALIMAEAVTVSAILNQLVKFGVSRERPFVADLSAAAKAQTAHPADNNLSFYSAHSNTAFALAVSAGTIAHLRGYEAEPYVWGVGLTFATFVAYSRLAAKKHYLSDVLVGSASGAAFGFFVPWLHHKLGFGQKIVLVPLPDGVAIAGVFD